MEKKRILIFPAGAENAIEIYDALRYNVNVEIFGASSKKDFADFLYDVEHYIEGEFQIANERFTEHFEKMLLRYQIDVVIPTHDDIALYLAEKREMFSANILVASAKTAYICRYKSLTYELFKEEGFCPKVYKTAEQIGAQDYPVFVKPDKASGGQGAEIVKSELDLKEEYLSEAYVLCEYLPGVEITVDCFTDRKRMLIFAGARTRDRVMNGIALRSTALQMEPVIREIAERINNCVEFFGAWYFQLKKDRHGDWKLLEISCRQSTGMTLYRHMGVNFPMLGIFQLYGIDTSFVMIEKRIQFERRMQTAFRCDIDFKKVYLDFDDTILVRDRVCPVMICFLYQCVDDGKEIILITRHDGELEDIFEKHRINGKLFEIIHITFGNDKSDYIDPCNAIFIDNSYVERKKVHDRFGIPVLDVDAVDMLIKN